eukprot:875991-Pelagomonas_calceolata.AAC.4
MLVCQRMLFQVEVQGGTNDAPSITILLSSAVHHHEIFNIQPCATLIQAFVYLRHTVRVAARSGSNRINFTATAACHLQAGSGF